jgi:glycosyltransferase involved in cell wall biosynthesis
MPEIVENGDTGLLFDKGDSEELGRIVSRLAADPALMTAMGTNGQKAHRCHYTVECMAERIEGVYEGLTVPSHHKRQQHAL